MAPTKVQECRSCVFPNSKVARVLVVGIMEKKMEATMVYWGLSGRDNGKENGNYYETVRVEPVPRSYCPPSDGADLP